MEESKNGTNPIVWDFYVANFTAIELEWKIVAGVNYQGQSSATLSSNSWMNAGDVIVGDGSTNIVFESTRHADEKYYRVITIPSE